MNSVNNNNGFALMGSVVLISLAVFMGFGASVVIRRNDLIHQANLSQRRVSRSAHEHMAPSVERNPDNTVVTVTNTGSTPATFDHLLLRHPGGEMATGPTRWPGDLVGRWRMDEEKNLLKNPGFELDSLGEEDPAYWQYPDENGWNVNDDYTAPNSDGQKSMGSYWSLGPGHWPSAYIYNNVSVKGGEGYRAEFWVRFQGFSDGNWDGANDTKQYVYEDDARLHLKWHDSSGTLLQEDKTRWAGDAYNRGLDYIQKNGDWFRFSKTYTAPDNADYVLFQIDGGDGNNDYIDPEDGHGGNAGIWIDDAVLFKNQAANSAGKGESGTIYGASRVEGKLGNALKFDGDDDYVALEPKTLYDYVGNGGYSVVVRAKPHEDVSAGRVYGGSYGMYGMGFGKGWQGIVYEVHTTNDSYGFGGYGGSYSAGGWTHLALTTWQEDGRIYVKGYQDGDVIVSDDISAEDYSNDWTLTFGADHRGTSANLNGTIDSVRIYDRALSPDEVNELMKYDTLLNPVSLNPLQKYSVTYPYRLDDNVEVDACTRLGNAFREVDDVAW